LPHRGFYLLIGFTFAGPVEFCQSGFNRLEKRNLILNIHCLFMRNSN
jgi:hypothetical protein